MMVEALMKRFKHAHADDGRFRDWPGGFQNAQVEQIDREIGPLCEGCSRKLTESALGADRWAALEARRVSSRVKTGHHCAG